MKTIAAASACVLLALSAPAFALSATESLQENGSPSGPSPSHAKMQGDRGTESGKAPRVTEGRASATDAGKGLHMKPMATGDSGTVK
jgi:hypothetical protein